MDGPNLELPSRREIYRAIAQTPGIHFRALLDELTYAQGTLQYHLRWLEAEGLVERSEDGEYTRYYATNAFDPEDRPLMNALRRTYARRIVAYLAAEGPMTTTGLAEVLGKSNSTVSWHLSKLHDAGLVEKRREGRSVYYELVDPDRVRRLYTVYRGSLTDRLVDRLFDLWESY